MKRRDIERQLKDLGWHPSQKKANGPHEKWTNGQFSLPVPRHREINEFTAKGILTEAVRYNRMKTGQNK